MEDKGVRAVVGLQNDASRCNAVVLHVRLAVKGPIEAAGVFMFRVAEFRS